MTYIGYITGPRAEQPTGVRVVEPPPGTRQYQRGNLYAVVDLSGEHPDRAAVADRLLSDMQRAYYSARGSQSQVLIAALQQAQQSLREVNAHTQYYPLKAGLLCAALLNGKLLVVASGAAFAMVRVSDKVHMFPSEMSLNVGGYSLADGPVEIYRQDVQPDDVFFVGGGSWFNHVPVRTLAGIVAFTTAENCTDAADELFDVGGRVPLPGLLIVLGANSEPPRPGAPPPGSGSPPPRPRRPRFGGLPTALSATPPARLPASTPLAASSSPVAPPAAFAPTEPAPPMAASQAEIEVDVAPGEPIFPPPAPVSEAPAEARRGPVWPGQLGAAAAQGLRQAKELFNRMLPEPAPLPRTAAFAPVSPHEARDEQGRLIESVETIGRAEKRAGEAARQDAEAMPPVREPPPGVSYRTRDASVHAALDAAVEQEPPVLPTPVLELPPFVAPPPARGARARLFLLLALVIVLMVPVIVAALHFFKGIDQGAEAAQLTSAAQAQLVGAQAALDLGDKTSARQQLIEALDFLDQAVLLDGSNPERDRLRATIESELQEVQQIVPLYGLTEPLITFPPEAQPRRVLVVDEDIFVLDAARQAIFQYRFDPATERVSDQAGMVVIQQDSVVDGVTVGPLADMAWLPQVPGYEDRPTLLIVDRNNNVFRYDPRVEGATRMVLGGQADWGSISQIETYQNRLYIADEGAGELYRYSLGALNTPGDAWFSEQTQVNLAGAIALEIDGDVWFLFSNGMILRYRSGEQVPFSPENSIGLAEEPTDLYVFRQELNLIYLVDTGEDRILVYDKTGAYLSQLRAPEGELLRGLSSVYVDEVAGTMYLLTQSALFTHPVWQ
ncbi:MAG: hypothetical protein IT329_22585 [Caldilineaceae bacterium]|nr:hypothetical protein [Caldilineaceae bacterium]